MVASAVCLHLKSTYVRKQTIKENNKENELANK